MQAWPYRPVRWPSKHPAFSAPKPHLICRFNSNPKNKPKHQTPSDIITMKISAQLASCVMTMTALLLQGTQAAPVASDPPSVAVRDVAPVVVQERGSSCSWWREDDSDGYSKMKIKCDKVGQGLKTTGSFILYDRVGMSTGWTDYNSLGQVRESPRFPSSYSTESIKFHFVFQPSGMPDMGKCDSELVEVEHAIKNGWYNKMTCTEISPWLEVRAVLDIPGAFNQFSEWISSPGQVQTLEREAWFGKPRAYAGWQVKN